MEQQQQVLEYAQMLQQDKADKGTERKPSSWRSHPAVGMWKDREDMKDVKECVSSCGVKIDGSKLLDALANDLPLLTRNQKDFRFIDGLTLVTQAAIA